MSDYESKYILRRGQPIPESDLYRWADFVEHRRHSYQLKTTLGPYWISTVFLGLDHSFAFDHRAPILFETMIVGPSGWEEYQTRCGTEREARQMHRRAKLAVRNRFRPSNYRDQCH